MTLFCRMGPRGRGRRIGGKLGLTLMEVKPMGGINSNLILMVTKSSSPDFSLPHNFVCPGVDLRGVGHVSKQSCGVAAVGQRSPRALRTVQAPHTQWAGCAPLNALPPCVGRPDLQQPKVSSATSGFRGLLQTSNRPREAG